MDREELRCLAVELRRLGIASDWLREIELFLSGRKTFYRYTVAKYIKETKTIIKNGGNHGFFDKRSNPKR